MMMMVQMMIKSEEWGEDNIKERTKQRASIMNSKQNLRPVNI